MPNKLKKKIIKIINIIILIIVIIQLLIIYIQRKNINSNKSIVEISEESENKQVKTISTENWDLEKVNIVYDLEGIPVPVPKGFIGSNVTGENTINNGFVIYELDEIDDEEFEINDENAWEMSINRNQFVWVPIYKPNELYGRDANGIARGKLYTFNNAGRSPFDWSELSDGTMVVDISKNYEPMKDNINTSYTPEFLSEEAMVYNKNFENMIASTIKYGGFYVGRYETGFTDTGANVHRMNINITNKTGIERINRCKNICHNENVATEMIYGCQFDAILQWFYDTGKKSYVEISENSTSWGNYYDASFSYKDMEGNDTNQKNLYNSQKIPTGSAEHTKVNNIYDIAGNAWECTQEICKNNAENSVRGGSYGDYGRRKKSRI